MNPNKDKVSAEEQYERNILFLSKHVPPDDIYPFAESMMHISYYFLRKWMDEIDVQDECKKDEVTAKYVNSLMGYLLTRDLEIEEKYRMGFFKTDEED